MTMAKEAMQTSPCRRPQRKRKPRSKVRVIEGWMSDHDWEGSYAVVIWRKPGAYDLLPLVQSRVRATIEEIE